MPESYTALARSLFSFVGLIQRVNEEAPDSAVTAKHFNPSFYDENLDYDKELVDDVRLYGRDEPDELDFTDAWESSY